MAWKPTGLNHGLKLYFGRILNVSPTSVVRIGPSDTTTAKTPTNHRQLRLDIEHLEQTLEAAVKMLSRVKSKAKKVK